MPVETSTETCIFQKWWQGSAVSDFTKAEVTNSFPEKQSGASNKPLAKENIVKENYKNFL